MSESTGKPNLVRGVIRWAIQVSGFALILAACLFISSWRLDWPMAWAYLGLFVGSQVLTALILIPTNPALLVERAESREGMKEWDRVLVVLVTLVGPASMWIVAGLDARWGWSPSSPEVLQVVALAVAALSSLLTIWSMASNAFFSGVVRIQKDRGQTVATGGPYRFVRHPGYAGGVLFDLATPLALGSLWTFVPAVLTVCAIVARTALEDRTLREEFAGYEEYTQRTRYRLLPGIW